MPPNNNELHAKTMAFPQTDRTFFHSWVVKTNMRGGIFLPRRHLKFKANGEKKTGRFGAQNKWANSEKAKATEQVTSSRSVEFSLTRNQTPVLGSLKIMSELPFDPSAAPFSRASHILDCNILDIWFISGGTLSGACLSLERGWGAKVAKDQDIEGHDTVPVLILAGKD